MFVLLIEHFLTLFTQVAIKLQYRSQPYFEFSNLQAIASFIDFSRIVASTRHAGRSANECSDRKNSQIYSLVYNNHFTDGRIIPRTPVTPYAVYTGRFCGFTTQYHTHRILFQ